MALWLTGAPGSPDLKVTSLSITMIRLIESDAVLAPLCRTIEARVAARSQMLADTSVDVPVVLLVDFSSMDTYTNEPALFESRGEPRIVVNGSVFFTLSEVNQIAIAGHELAHAPHHARGERHPVIGWDEIETDLLACRLGFVEELLAERGAGYGPEYADALGEYADLESARTKRRRWHNQRMAGIIKPPRRAP